MSKSEVVRIEAVTPVTKTERVESELQRIGALKKPPRERGKENTRI